MASGQAPDTHALAETARRILVSDVVPFWSRLQDRRHGGYCLNHDLTGRWRGPCEKYLVTQARTLWFFARLAREGLVPAEGASAGYRFMRDCMWDEAHGGFYWAVDHAGTRATKPRKHLYGQAFALYALCEHAQMSSDPEANALCSKLYGVIDERAHDGHYGGYHESFTSDWGIPAGRSLSYLDKRSDRKLFNTHLHLLEAFTSLVKLGHGDLARARLSELLSICSETVVDGATGGCRDEFRRDWSPLRGARYDRASYGHDLENVALLNGAASTLGTGGEPLLRRCLTICSHALAHGHDRERGGFFAGGPLGRPADRREKIYWIQAEAMLGLLSMWQATGEALYFECMADTLAWVDTQQVDRSGGDWHEIVTPQGIRMGDKAGAWKDPYHQTRALLAVSALVTQSVGGA